MFKKSHLVISTLALVLMIDGLGQGILYPVLARALMNVNSVVLGHFSSENSRYIFYGLSVGIFFLARFFGGAFLGDVSDSYGRKPTLIICVAGSVVGYFFCALAFYFHTIYLLLLGRAIDGLSAGNQPIAKASMIDYASEDKKSQYIGLVMGAVAVGIILGPVIGGIFSDKSLSAYFSNQTPMYIAMALSLLSLLILAVFYTDTNTVKRKVKIRLLRVFTLFAEAYQNRGVRRLSIAFFFMHLGWCIYLLYAAAYVFRHFSFSANGVTWYVTAIGVGLMFGLAVLPRYTKRIKSQKIPGIVGYILLGLSILIITFPVPDWVLWVLVVPGCASVGLAYTRIMPLFSKEVSTDRQGWVMGIASSIVALAAAIGPFFSSVVDVYSTALPMGIAAIIIFFGCFLMGIWARD